MPINIEQSLRSIVRQIAEMGDGTQSILVEVTYRPRLTPFASADTYGLGVLYDARRLPLMSGEFDGQGRRWARWALYAIRDQPIQSRPIRLGKIVEANSNEWHIEQVEWSFGNLRFLCDCTQAVMDTVP